MHRAEPIDLDRVQFATQPSLVQFLLITCCPPLHRARASQLVATPYMLTTSAFH
jgi:hypothetical protein